MFTYTGRLIDSTDGVPSVEDVAVALGRIPRLCGAGQYWWSYLHYAYATMEIALMENQSVGFSEDDLAAQCLIRNAHCAVTLLWAPMREQGDVLQRRIHEKWSEELGQNIPYPHEGSDMKALVDRADSLAFLSEVHTFAPTPMKQLPIFSNPGTWGVAMVNELWAHHDDPNHSGRVGSKLVQAYQGFFEPGDAQYSVSRLRSECHYKVRPYPAKEAA